MNYPIIKQLRKENNLTQEDIAEILSIKREVYRRYEAGQREIPLSLLIQLADYYKVTLDYMVGREI